MRFDLNATLEVLIKTPVILKTWLSGQSSEWTHSDEGPDTWSAYDIVGHLIHGEKTDWIPRAKIILAGNPKQIFQPFDRFAQFENSHGNTIDELLEEFEKLRHQNLDTLRSWKLGDEKFQMKAKHPELGAVSLSELLACWTVHDLSHIAQIARVMAIQYQDQVGPWTAYLGILKK